MRNGTASGEVHAGLKFCRQVLHPLITLVAVACLLSFIGWTSVITEWQHWATTAAGVIFGLERGWVFRVMKPQGKEQRRLGFHALLAALVFATAAVLLLAPLSAAGEWSVGGHVFIQLAVFISGLTSMIHHQKKLTAKAFHPGLVLIGSFLFIILAGGLLLKMPRCVVPGESLSWLDAFFTSTSAVCVTGLTVQDTATFFSLTGQSVILLLIQLGGLGIMTLAFFAAVVLFEGLSLHDRLLLGKMIQENRLARIGRTLAFIVGMTFVCEGIGMVVLYSGMEAIADPQARLFHSGFHAVSAFCNAGFSTFTDGMASGVVSGNWTWQICIMALVVIGGLGSLVNEDLSQWTMARLKKRLGKSVPQPRLRVHTRLVLLVTGSLIVAGAALVLITEFHLGDGPENGGKIITAAFHSITARTAGFNTVPMAGLNPLTVQILMLLMIIGGSPGGTAGGLRTTVIAIGLAHLWNQLRIGRRGIVAFNRIIPQETGAQALGLIVLAGIWLGANFVLLQVLQAGSGVSETTLFFELISAFATVGLSLDLTPSLTEGGKALLIVNMFVGRIGLLTVMATFIRRDPRPASGKPTENILLN
ncbi:MAG: potassium transporter TrkG [Akkermansiaceae bacterium]